MALTTSVRTLRLRGTGTGLAARCGRLCVVGDHRERLNRNIKSRDKANHFAEEWSEDEVVFLMQEFALAKSHPEEEAVVAEILGRTIEACRQKFYQVRAGSTKVVRVKETTTRTITTRETYIGYHDDPDECWWNPSTNNQ